MKPEIKFLGFLGILICLCFAGLYVVNVKLVLIGVIFFLLMLIFYVIKSKENREPIAIVNKGEKMFR